MRCVVYGWHVILIYIILYTCVVLRMVLNNQSSERLACSSLLNHKPFSVQMYLWSEHFAKGRHPFFHIFSFCSVFWREGFLSFFITNFCKWFQRKIILWFGSARKERSTTFSQWKCHSLRLVARSQGLWRNFHPLKHGNSSADNLKVQFHYISGYINIILLLRVIIIVTLVYPRYTWDLPSYDAWDWMNSPDTLRSVDWWGFLRRLWLPATYVYMMSMYICIIYIYYLYIRNY